MGLGFIIAGIVFLVNPNINIIDILPDFIGCILIVIGLSKTAMLHDSFAEAKDAFWRLALIELVKVGCIVFVPYVDSTFLLVLVFSFAVIEVITLVPAISKLFEAFYDLGMKYGCEAVYAKKIKTERVKDKACGDGGASRKVIIERAEGIRLYFQLFVIIKAVLSVLPELPALQLYDYIGSVGANSLNYAQFKPLFYVFSWLLTMVFGVICLIKLCPYINSIRKSKETCEKLKELYADRKINHPKQFIARRIKKMLALASLGSFFVIDMRFSGVNVFPNVLAASFFILIFIMLIKYDKLAIAGALTSLVWGIASVLNFSENARFLEKYEINAVEWIPDAEIMYDELAFKVYIEYAIGIAAVVLLAVTLYRVIRGHIELLGGDFSHLQYKREERNAELRTACKIRLICAAVFGVAALVANAAYVKLVINHPALWVVNFALALIWAIAITELSSYAGESIYERMYDEAI